MRRVILALVVLTCVVPVMRSERAHAYEADVHYAWTYYLALHVGYTKRQAFQLASATYAIDESPATSPMEAGRGEVIYGARHQGIRPLEHRTGPNERIAEIWSKFHAFAETNYVNVPGMVEDGRRKRIGFLWDLAKREGNPGPMMHFIQDYHSHFMFDNVRGHAFAGHGPDYPGTNHQGAPDPALAKDTQMTKDSIHALRRFMQEVLLAGDHPFLAKQRTRLPRQPDVPYLMNVFRELVKVNPAPMANPLGGLPQATANYTPGVGPDLLRAVRVINHVITMDERTGRLPSSPFASGPTMSAAGVPVQRRPDEPEPLPDRWHQWQFDFEGHATDRGHQNQYRVENVAMRFVNSQANVEPAGTNLAFEYTIDGIARHPMGRLKILEKHTVEMGGRIVFVKENVRALPDNDPRMVVGQLTSMPADGRVPTQVVKDKVPFSADMQGMPAGSPAVWTMTVHWQGVQPEARKVSFQPNKPAAPQRGCKPNCESPGTWICENPEFFQGWNRADSCPAKDPETRRRYPYR